MNSMGADAGGEDVALDRVDAIAPAEPPAPPTDMTVNYYHLDAMGSVRAITDVTDTVIIGHIASHASHEVFMSSSQHVALNAATVQAYRYFTGATPMPSDFFGGGR
jgi:hypothetical protein